MSHTTYPRTLLKNYLDLKRIPYQHLSHPPTFTAGQLAAAERVPAEIVAKTVVVKADSQFVLAVLPATEKISFPALGEAVGSRHLRLATEYEFQQLFPDSDVGAMSPFGNLYELPVYAEQSLAEQEEIVFNAGTHEDAIQMRFHDFAETVRPRLCGFSCQSRN